MGLFDILKKEHEDVLDILNQIEALGPEIKEHPDLIESFYKALEFHNTLQEKFIYEPLAEKEKGIFFLKSKEEHDLVEGFFDELHDLEAGSPLWLAKFHLLKDILERHIQQEETQGFDLMRKHFDEEGLDC